MDDLKTASTLMTEALDRVARTATPLFSDVIAPAFNVDGAMRLSGFPNKFIGRDWTAPDFVKKYEPPKSRDDFRDFKGLFLTGPTGRKKTASLCLMARDWMLKIGERSSKAWRFVSFPALCVELQEAWKDGGSGPMEIIESLARVPLLILDDVGVEKTTGFVVQSAYLIFNRREMDEMPTYGTSNLTIEQIGSKLDERIASRIRGMCHVVEVGGEDQSAKR